MDSIRLKARAKINLGLDVLGKREDGYHEVRMVMQTLYLYDNVTLQKKSAPGIEIDSNLFICRMMRTYCMESGKASDR